MILEPQNVPPSLLDGLLSCIPNESGYGPLGEYFDKECIKYDSAVEKGDPTEHIRNTVRKAYNAGELLDVIDSLNMWLPNEAVKILQGEEISDEEKLNLADILDMQSKSDSYDETLALERFATSDFSTFLRQQVWKRDPIPVSQDYLYDASHRVQMWHPSDSWERFTYFFTTGMARVLGEEWRQEKIASIFAQSAKKVRKEEAKNQAKADERQEFRDICFDAYYSIEYLDDDKVSEVFPSPASEHAGAFLVKRAEDMYSPYEDSPSCRADTWLWARHIWKSRGYLWTRYPEFGMTWSWWYGLLVLFGVGVLLADFGGFGVSVFPVYLGVFLVPVVGFWLALRFVSKRIVWLVLLGIFVVGLAGRLWLISDPAGIGGIDPSMMLLTFLVGVVVGLYPVYWGGSYRQVLRNADKYGPFACVWFRPFKDETIGKDGVEFVLTDSDGEIVWIRRMSQSAAERFTGQFVYEHPDSGVWNFFGAEEHWRQVFPALLCPREVVRDWKYWRTMFRVRGDVLTPNDFGLRHVSLIKNRAWWTWLFRETLLWRPNTLSEAHLLNVPGLSYESRDAYIGEFGLDKHPRGYEQALTDGRLVKAGSKY